MAEDDRLQELEALEAIFGPELKLGGDGDESAQQVAQGHARFQLQLDEPLYGVRARLAFRYTPQYPDAAPEISVLVDQGVSAAAGAALQKVLLDEAQSQLGLPMIYTLHTVAKEWIADHAIGGDEGRAGASTVGVVEASFETRDLQAEHADDAKKFHGTPVTPESFAEWKVKFDAEHRAHTTEEVTEGRDERMSGRALFETNKAVISEESLSLWEDEADAYDDEEVEVEAEDR
ncbi:RWD domain-containing protein [Porphyridium purpureum]|uniref:RWD domain-containing protein n=1 Tax=Porphyridium purpureum TaxID=35688 RepID=A0A5J4YKP1_PORPP|nr:RWD domain-containing protein [Porphyridium purpureum]|eukprot:POR1134..scf297_16